MWKVFCIWSTQQIGHSGNYYRTKHYVGLIDGKPKYFSCQQSKEYALQKLSEMNVVKQKKSKKTIDQMIDKKHSIIDQQNYGMKSISKNKDRTDAAERLRDL